MILDHHVALLAGYGVAVLGREFLRRGSRLAAPTPPPGFARPWVEVGLATLAVAAVIGIGSLWSARWLLPEGGSGHVWAAAANQILIFSPMGLLLLLRRQGLETAWLPSQHLALRLAVGLVLSTVALLVFHWVRGQDLDFAERWSDTWSPVHIDKIVQVFLEDFSIAVVFCRLGAALGRPWVAMVAVGVLFAAAHLPAMASSAASAGDYVRLVLDAGLAVVVLGALQRSRDIWWFWPVHFAMDMTQYS